MLPIFSAGVSRYAKLARCDWGLTEGITYPWLKLVTYGLSMMMLKSLYLTLTISVTLILFMLFYKRKTWWKHLRAIGLVPKDASWRPPSMHCLLSFTLTTFFILWPLSPAASSVSWYWSCFVCSELAYEIYSGVGLSTYVYCVVSYRVIVAPYVRSVGHVFAYLYTLDDDLERPMVYETSLLPKVFPYYNLRTIVFVYLRLSPRVCPLF